jgi:ferredoxin-NADP reductase
MLASLGVLGVSTYVFSVVFGRLFNVEVHSESSYITALILALIFSPTLQVFGLVVLGLAGVIAAASKFVLTIRGRHIFNPAAIAAVVVSFSGLGFASWWVATPPLFIPTLLLGFFIIYKTRRFLVGGMFIALSTILVLVFLLSQGDSLTDSLVLLLSWPILFFSGFMLTEPLTLPRKKSQQIIEVLIVAPLFAIPIGFGDFTTTPALALVIGNLYAFIVSRRQAVTLVYEGSKKLSDTSRELTFSATQPVQYEAGEYMEITVPHPKKDLRGIRRSFSVTSPANDRKVSFGIKFYERSSSFKKALAELPVGYRITATSVNGDFTLPKDPSVPLLLVAGGIGITPFISHLRTLKKHKQTRDIVLFYLVKSEKDLAYIDLLKKAGVQVYIVTKSDTPLSTSGVRHINESRLSKDTIIKYVTDANMRYAYVSGPPLMVDSVQADLKNLGLTHIKTDYFIGY